MHDISWRCTNKFLRISYSFDSQQVGEVLSRRRSYGLERRKNQTLHRKIFQLALARFRHTIDWRIPRDKMDTLSIVRVMGFGAHAANEVKS
jgi:hypothetical protein